MGYQKYIAILALFVTSGCATLIEGRSQELVIDTQPEGATCILRSNDEVIGIVSPTPGTIKVNKSKYDIVLECTKEGYIKSKIKNHADYAIAGIGNMAMLNYSFVGNMIDSATGASNKYDSHMLIALDEDKDAKTAQQLASLKPAPAPAPVQLAATPPAEPSYMAVPVAEVTQASLPKPLPSTPQPAAAAIEVAQAQALTPPPAPKAEAAAPDVAPLKQVAYFGPPHPGSKVTRITENTIELAQFDEAQCN